MSDTDGTKLPGLPGNNPLGFLASLGLQTALAEQGDESTLHWTNDPIPYPIVCPALDLREAANAVRVVSLSWLDGPALDETIDPKLKLKPPGIREYLSRSRAVGRQGALASCLLAEGSLDKSGKAKPTDLYFTAGQQKFASMARSILEDATEQELIADMQAPWRYQSRRDTLMWDSADDRLHAHSASDPSKSKKLTNPGAEALAIIGLSRYPCFASIDRTLTQGCSGRWKSGEFVWPLWAVPATVRSVQSILAHADSPETHGSKRSDYYRSWGLIRVMQSQIRRSGQGGYGTFGPPRIVWQHD